MAYSTQTATSDGSLVLLDISLEYFDRSEISVLFDGVIGTYPWAWVGSTDKKISFTPAIPNGVQVTVKRTSDLAEIRHSLEGGAAFTDQTMDENFQQILRIAQEATEGGLGGDFFQDIDMHGFSIRNVGAGGTGPLDLVNYEQMTANNVLTASYVVAAQTAESGAVAAKVAAEAARDVTLGALDTKVDEGAITTSGLTMNTGKVLVRTTAGVGAVEEKALTDFVQKDVSTAFTAPQSSTPLGDNDLSFDLSSKQNFDCTPSAPGTLQFTNLITGLNGNIVLVNSGHAISKAAHVKCNSTFLSTISAAGTYWISYYVSGSSVYVSTGGAST